MSDHDYGPLLTYEVTWTNGHVERVRGHLATFEGATQAMLAGFVGVETRTTPRVLIYGEFDGRWRLVLAAPEDQIAVIRDLSTEGLEVSP